MFRHITPLQKKNLYFGSCGWGAQWAFSLTNAHNYYIHNMLHAYTGIMKSQRARADDEHWTKDQLCADASTNTSMSASIHVRIEAASLCWCIHVFVHNSSAFVRLSLSFHRQKAYMCMCVWIHLWEFPRLAL